MGVRSILFHISLLVVAKASSAADTVVDPRGARPIENAQSVDKCSSQKEWPFCSDDDWGSKCPSGCRIEGLMMKYDHLLLKKVEKARALLDQSLGRQRSADQTSKQTYDFLRDRLVTDSGNDNRFFNLAETLRQRISEMKIKIDRQVQQLAAMKQRVRDQVTEMQKLEVDIDMKLRACKGSCKKYVQFSVDKDSYTTLDKQLTQLEAQSAQSVETVGSLYVMKSLPLQSMEGERTFKSGTLSGQQHQDLFSDANTIHLVLEREGSSQSTPASVSKVPPGTSSHSSSSSSSSSSSIKTSSLPSGSGGTGKVIGPGASITVISGRGDGSVGGGNEGLFESFDEVGGSGPGVHTVSCKQRTTKTVVHTADGPVERFETVMEGGPACQDAASNLGPLFPSLGHGSSAASSSIKTTSHTSSSSSTKTLAHSGSAKGSLLDTKTGFADPFAGTDLGIDLGAFATDAGEDDLPDFHARSVKSTRVERQSGYVGKVCSRPKQDGRHIDAEHRNIVGRCPADAKLLPLCATDDWGPSCPSGCRLQGLLQRSERHQEARMQAVCEELQGASGLTQSLGSTSSGLYWSGRETALNTRVSQQNFVEHAANLSRNLTSLWKRSTELSRQLLELYGRFQKQLEDLYRTEVDVDMKLRACAGSCRSVVEYTVDQGGPQDVPPPLVGTVPLPGGPALRVKLVLPADPAPTGRQGHTGSSSGVTGGQMSSPGGRTGLPMRFEDVGEGRLALEEQEESV